MKGWKEEEISNKDLMAPCGLYCGTCGVYIATRDGNEKFRTIMGNLYKTNHKTQNVSGACSLIHRKSFTVYAVYVE